MVYVYGQCVCVFAFRNALFLREIFRLHINLSMKTNYHVFLAIDQPSTGPDSSRIIQMHRIHKQTMSWVLQMICLFYKFPLLNKSHSIPGSISFSRSKSDSAKPLLVVRKVLTPLVQGIIPITYL